MVIFILFLLVWLVINIGFKLADKALKYSSVLSMTVFMAMIALVAFGVLMMFYA